MRTPTDHRNPTCLVESFEPRVLFAVLLDISVGEGTPLRTITFTDGDGTTGVVSVAGGSAVVRFDGLDMAQSVTGRNAVVTGTVVTLSTVTLAGRAPRATIRASGGDGRIIIFTGILAAGPARGFSGPDVILRGDSTLSNGIGKLEVFRTEDATLTINRGNNPLRTGASVTIGAAQDTDITSQQPLQQLRLGSWGGLDGQADVVTAPSVGTLRVGSDFTGDLNVSGNGLQVGRPSLVNASVGGRVDSGTWNVGGKTSRVSVGSAGGDWAGNFGDVANFTATGDLSGELQADSINVLRVGTLTDADVFINRPAAPRAVGLGRLVARGAITNTMVRANADIGTVTAASLAGTSLCAGVTGMQRGVLPTGPGDFFAPSAIRAVTLRGGPPGTVATDTFADSIIAAPNLGKMTLGTVRVDNSGTPFGLAADSITSLTATGAAGAPVRARQLDQPSESLDLTDFEVRVF